MTRQSTPTLGEEPALREPTCGGLLPENRPDAEFLLAAFANAATKWTGTSWAFMLAIGLIVVWVLSGPFFHYSDTWQLIINTGTTVITFLMVFLIQRAQNKDSQAIHLKLNELLAAVNGASNRLINAESLKEDDLQSLHDDFQKLLQYVARESSPTKPHTIEEASEIPVLE
jgi:low affinity Fe/Cu permease